MADEPELIIPRYKMILVYDILPGNRETYYQFVMGEMVPAMQTMGVYMTEAWHTAYGLHPIRMVTFVAEDLETIQAMFASDQWRELEVRFKTFVENYSCKVIEYRHGFQVV